MKKEYDFSKGERGKFYHPPVELNLPIYLEPDVAAFVRKHAKKKKVDPQKIINQWLRNNIETVRSIL
jgi:hypothetical protein